MKTQCPHCENEQDVPKVYISKEVKCLKCNKPFIASKHNPVRPKTPIVPDKAKNKPSGFYLQVLGIIGIIVSIYFAFVYSESLALEKNLYSGLYATSYIGSRTFLIETLIFGITFLGILLSLILIGIGSIAKNSKKNKI